jgi:hypothetical protein
MKLLLLFLTLPYFVYSNSYFSYKIEVNNNLNSIESFEIYKGQILAPSSDTLSHQSVAVCEIESSSAKYDELDNRWVFNLPPNTTSTIILKTTCLNKGYKEPLNDGMVATELKIINDYNYLEKVCADAHKVYEDEASKDLFNVTGKGFGAGPNYEKRCIKAFKSAIENVLFESGLLEKRNIREILYNGKDLEKVPELWGACEILYKDEVIVKFNNGEQVKLVDFKNGNGKTEIAIPDKTSFTILCDIKFLD